MLLDKKRAASSSVPPLDWRAGLKHGQQDANALPANHDTGALPCGHAQRFAEQLLTCCACRQQLCKARAPRRSSTRSLQRAGRPARSARASSGQARAPGQDELAPVAQALQRGRGRDHLVQRVQVVRVVLQRAVKVRCGHRQRLVAEVDLAGRAPRRRWQCLLVATERRVSVPQHPTMTSSPRAQRLKVTRATEPPAWAYLRRHEGADRSIKTRSSPTPPNTCGRAVPVDGRGSASA